MTDLALPLAAAVLIAGAVALSVGGLLVARRMGRGQSPRQNDFMGVIFTAVALLDSLLMAVVVFSAYQRFADAAQTVTEEAAAVVAAYRDTQIFPEPLRSEARSAFRDYVNEVVDNEWASHGTVRPHRSRDALSPVWHVYRTHQPTEALAQADLDGARRRLHDLELQRHVRHLAGETSVPGVLWLLLVGGGALVVGMACLFVVERRNVHVLQVVLLSGFIASVLALILAMNAPFTGDVHVSRDPFMHALESFDAIDLQPGATESPVPVRTERVTVEAERALTDTGVDVAVGDQVTISATGTISLDSSGRTGPSGVGERRDQRELNVIDGENHGTLIGRIGETGAPFAVGSHFSSAGLDAGRLFLGVNDRTLDNNSGTFSATVTLRGA